MHSRNKRRSDKAVLEQRMQRERARQQQKARKRDAAKQRKEGGRPR